MKYFATLLVVLVTACSGQPGPQATVWHPDENESLLMDAKQRIVISTTRNDQHVICAEPVPDVVSSVNTDFGFDANIGPALSRAGAADIGRTADETVTNLGKRTQSVQLLRDGLYRACEAYVNGLLDEEDYRRILVNYDEILVALTAIDALGNHTGSNDAVIAIEELVKTYFCLHNDLEICTPE
jgi:hypothetical protein